MGSLKYVGKPAAADPDLVYREYVAAVKNADLTSDAIDQAINSGLSAYASVSYVDTQDGLLATQAYIDTKDNLRLKLAQKGVANGIAQLDATAKVPPQLINSPLTQKFFRGPWSPASYGGAASFTTETTILTCGVTDPGFPYKLVIFGTIDGASSLDTEYPVFQVRVANETTGEIIATGSGASDGATTFVRGDDFNRNGPLGDDWLEQSLDGGAGSYGPTGSAAFWADGASSFHAMRAFRVNAEDRYTGTDFQRVQANIAVSGESRLDSSQFQYMRIYGRANDAHTQGVSWQISDIDARFGYDIGNGEVQLGDPVGCTQSGTLTMLCGDPVTGNPYVYSLYQNSTLVSQVEDLTAITPRGPSNRGWGFGMRAAPGFFNVGQTVPPALDFIGAGDTQTAFKPVIIVPKNMTVRTGSTSLYVRALRSGASSTGSYNPYKAKIHVLAVPA